MKVVAVIGPFRADTEYERRKNIAIAEELALQVWRLGCFAMCPHLNSAHFQDAAPDEVFLAGGLEILGRCGFAALKEETGMSETLYIIKWKSLITNAKGQGTGRFPKFQAQLILDSLIRSDSEGVFKRWIEPDTGDSE